MKKFSKADLQQIAKAKKECEGMGCMRREAQLILKDGRYVYLFPEEFGKKRAHKGPVKK